MVKAIAKVSTNPLPDYEGGYGKPLGNRNNSNLAGCMKIKLKASGLRIVYKIEKIGEQMFIIVIGARADDEVYEIANSRINKQHRRDRYKYTCLFLCFPHYSYKEKSIKQTDEKILSHLPLDSIETL